VADVETNGFLHGQPSRANYSFNPSLRSFSQLGETTEATFGATLSSSNFDNPLDTPEYYVRQHYLDFLGREPDEAGFNFWSDQIIECGTDQNCISAAERTSRLLTSSRSSSSRQVDWLMDSTEWATERGRNSLPLCLTLVPLGWEW